MKLTIPDQNTKYAIGIDFGHGETSFAFCAFSWGNTIGQLEKPQDLRTEGNRLWTLPSVYSIDKESGEMHIGSSGVENIQYSKEFKISFKKRPSLMTENEKCKYTEFMHQVHILMQQMSGFSVGEYVVYICRPSGWNKTEDNLYLNMACNAGIPIAGIWPESRAAMINNSLNSDLEMIDINQLHKGSLLIDFGSSTVDLTYTDEKMNFPIDDNGNDYGAQIVDIILYEYVLSLPGNELARQMIADENHWRLKDILLFECRKAKENFFSLKNYFTLNIPLSTYCLDDEEYSSGSFRCKKEYGEKEVIYQLIENGLFHINKQIKSSDNISPTVCESVNTGYYPKLKACLQEFVNKLPEKQIYCIILTGGASFMFLEEGNLTFRNKILKDVIPNYNNISILIDPNPSTTVSRGIAQVGRNYTRFVGCEGYENAETKVKRKIKEQTNSINGQNIQNKIATTIADEIMNKIDLSMYALKNGNITTLNEFQSQLDNSVKRTTANIDAIIKRNIDTILQEQLKEAQNTIKEIVKLYTTKDPILPEISHNVVMGKFDISVGFIVKDAVGSFYSMQKSLVTIFTLGIGLLFFNEEKDKNKKMQKNLEDWERQDIHSAYEKEIASNRSKIYSDINRHFDKSNFTTEIKKALISTINKYADNSIIEVKRIFK